MPSSYYKIGKDVYGTEEGKLNLDQFQQLGLNYNLLGEGQGNAQPLDSGRDVETRAYLSTGGQLGEESAAQKAGFGFTPSPQGTEEGGVLTVPEGINIEGFTRGSTDEAKQLMEQGAFTTGALPQELSNFYKSYEDQLKQTDDIVSRFMAAGVPTPEEQKLEQEENAIRTSAEEGIANEADRPATMGFVTGAQASIERRANVKLASVQRELTRLQGNRQAQYNLLKDVYDIRRQSVRDALQLYQMTAPEQLAIDQKSGTAYFRNKMTGKVTAAKLPGWTPPKEDLPGGIVGEYTYYVSQEKAAGRTPLSFDAYQTRDANRKAQTNNSLTESINAIRLQLMQKELTEGKPPTDAQRTLGTYASRLEQAIPTLEKLQDAIKNMNLVSFETQVRLPAALQTANVQQYMQAARNLINAILRRESGAVISPTEFSEARQQYLPQPGDSPEVLAQKKSNRDLVFASYRSGSGSAYQSLDSLVGGSNIEDLRAKYNY